MMATSSRSVLGDLISDLGLQQLDDEEEDNGGASLGKRSAFVDAGHAGDDRVEQLVLDLLNEGGDGRDEQDEAITAQVTGFGLHHTPLEDPALGGGGSRGLATSTKGGSTAGRPHVRILIQPAENRFRFRYPCEGRSAGSLQGESNGVDADAGRLFPTIQVVGHSGPAVCVVSLVEHEAPYRVHPHNLVGKDVQSKNGICKVDITSSDMTYSFQSLGIQCVRKKDAVSSLQQREKEMVDPFKQGYAHGNGNIDLNQVRLCFQVFLRTGSKTLVPLQPVVSNVIKDRRAHTDLQIVDYSDDRSPVEGGKKILLFCEKVDKGDIEVHFTQRTKSGEQVVIKGEMAPTDVHKQFGISLRTPPYVDRSITDPVLGAMYLYRPKTKASSEPVDFWYVPRKPQQQQNEHEENFNFAEVKPVAMKRGRAQKPAKDEPSSGLVAVPSKIPTAQLRHGGGQVTVAAAAAAAAPEQEDVAGLSFPGMSNLSKYMERSQQQQCTSQIDNVGGRAPTGASVPIRQQDKISPSLIRSPYEHVAYDEAAGELVMRPNEMQQQQLPSSASSSIPGQFSIGRAPAVLQSRVVSDMTQGLQELLRRDEVAVPENVQRGSSSMGMLLQHDHSFLLAESVALNDDASSSLPNLSLSDLAFGDIDTLSGTLDSSLRISDEIARLQQLSSSSSACGNNNNSFPKQQLDTPDVSMDGGARRGVSLSREEQFV